MIKKKYCIAVLAAIVMAAAGIIIYKARFAPTKVAFVNYQAIELGRIGAAVEGEREFRLSIAEAEDFARIGRNDFVFVNAMGMRITEEERALIMKAAAKGLPIITTMITNPANDFNTLDSLQRAKLEAYLSGGGSANYRNMLRYVRAEIDGKHVSEAVGEPFTPESGILYHADAEAAGNEEKVFHSVKSYEEYLSSAGIFKSGAPAVVLTGQMGESAELAAALESSGNNVYCVSDMQAFVRDGMADSLNLAAVINMAHGRMGDYMVEYLSKRNVPLFSPLNVNELESSWAEDKMGMTGGFLSQSVVTPEIDGAIRPFALFAHYEDRSGLRQVKAIPGRIDEFVQTVNNYIGLQNKPNSGKKLAIFYYKGPGQNALTASGMEVLPSLYNLLLRLRAEGYNVSGLPSSEAEFERRIMNEGAVFGTYAEGAIAGFIASGKALTVSEEEFRGWCEESLGTEMTESLLAEGGVFPGSYMATDDGKLALPRVQFGNVVLLPQMAAGGGDDEFAMVHGTEAAPPYPYIAQYLWVQHGFGADAIMHFGTHGSLEYTPSKQVALSSRDWPDRLVGTMPHLYVYTISNVGEAMIAKRRSYAGIQSYLTPPFMESGLSGTNKALSDAIARYYRALADENAEAAEKASREVKTLTVKAGIHRELRLDSLGTDGYTEAEIARIDNFAEELSNEKITGELYTMGEPYEDGRIRSSVYAMATEPIAYALLAIDRAKGKVPAGFEDNRRAFNERYLAPARRLVGRMLDKPSLDADELTSELAGISPEMLRMAIAMADAESSAAGDMMAMMRAMAASGAKMPAGMGGASASVHPGSDAESMPQTHKELFNAVAQLRGTLKNVPRYEEALQGSPESEMRSILNALDGGYVRPTPGGDPIVNPNTLPTGRNMYAVNAEATPSEKAWEEGVSLAEKTIEMYRSNHNDSLLRKVSYTLWSGEFIETEGATLAQAFYMLGVEPLRDAFGRVTDLRLIPSERLGRPRIDVLVQTSGQLRDLASSRLFLLSRAMNMAAGAEDDIYPNYVAEGVVASEKILTEKGLSPREAREISHYRVFGGMNGSYGTGITGMVQAGDRWEEREEIARTYINNMGAYYGSESKWEEYSKYALEAALTGTDVVVQPRQSNTWGALSLDHVYEFMGGLNLAAATLGGKEPDAYLSDYRNHHNMRMQELKEAIGVESRTTILNPNYIREKMKGGASAAAGFAEIVQNTYGWNVTKESVIDDELWNDIYDVYVQDSYGLGVHEYFGSNNPAALEEMTAVMLESARKGLWNASGEQLAALAELHTRTIAEYGPSCSGAVCDNAPLRQFIASNVDARTAQEFDRSISRIREAQLSDATGTVMKRERLSADRNEAELSMNDIVIAAVALLAAAGLVILVRKRRKS